MFRIRKAQMEALARAEEENFDDRLYENVRENFPEESEELGEEKTRATIRYGRERAASYGFQSRDDVTRYVGLVFAFSRDFDLDPEMPWAREILTDPKQRDTRMDRLYERAQRELDEEETGG